MNGERFVFHRTSETFIQGSKTLPQEFYTSPDVFSQEQEKIFGKFWVCAGHVSRIPNTGDYFLLNIGDESLIVVRGQNEDVNSFYNVCRHRGTRICTNDEGEFAKSIQCSYHAWTYNLGGELIGAPSMAGVEDFNMKDYPLRKTPVHVWEGFIFVNLGGSQAKPFEKTYPDLPSLSKWNLGNLKSHSKIPYDVDSNWKHIFQNFNECYHCPTVHPALAKIADFTSGSNDLTYGPALGGSLEFIDAESMTITGRSCALPLGNLSQEESKRGYYYSILPNLLLNVHPDYVMFHLITPEAPGKTKIVSEWLFNPDAFTRPDFDPMGAVEFWDMTNKQDWEYCKRQQMGVRSRGYSPGPYSPRESLLAAFDKYYLEILAHSKE